jgi:hypothetical protein
MAIHFVHIGKSGGTAIKFAIRQAGKEALGDAEPGRYFNKAPWQGPMGIVYLQGHAFKLKHVPDEDQAFFSVRDPAKRFVSSFYSRLRKGMPRHFTEWSEREAQAFEWFSTPQELALALAKRRGKKREQAEFAMNGIRHIRRPMRWWIGRVENLQKRLPQVAYIARQETLSEDWERIKTLLALPPELDLPSDPVNAHKSGEDVDRTLNRKMLDALRDWYAEDYKLLDLCDEVRPALIARVDELARGTSTSGHRA